MEVIVKKIRSILKIVMLTLVCFVFLLACGKGGNKTISVVSREEGSGTRGAFIELFKVETKDASGKKIDQTTDSAIVTNSTAVMLTTVAGDESAIGYISLGSLNNTVKALEIDGVKATVNEIKSGKYKISRPFNIAIKTTVSPAAQDFIDFILSPEGQSVVTKTGYISIDNVKPYKTKVTSGKVTISGSSSVTPVMEKLKEAYLAVNPNIKIEIQQSDSSTGATNVIDGTSDIGMVSRELKDTEKKKGIHSAVIAIDGLAVIVNSKNSISGLKSEQIRDIFTGTETSWSAFLSK